MSSKNNGFTVSDIERYYSGKMSPEEKHALEKAALDDPFLADALEGYAFTSTPFTDLVKIQSRLDEKLNNNKVVPVFQKYKWLSVAAILLVIAGAGWFAYDLSTAKRGSAVAVQNEKKTEKNSEFLRPEQQISTDSVANTTTSVYSDATEQQQDGKNQKDKVVVNKNAITQKTGEGLVSNATAKKNFDNNKEESYSNSGRRLLTQNEAETNNPRVSTVQPRDMARNNAISPDTRSNNIANNNIGREQGYYKDISSNNAPVKLRGVNQNDTINIVLHPLPKDSLQSMQEVVIGYGIQKKSIEKYPKVTIDTLEPAEGFVKFDDYVINNLKMPEELKTKTISGEVQLSFDVDKEGQPINITVVKSLCEKCDEEAIRLLKEGPKWKKKKNKKGKITIKF
jgi:TonB family protein